MAMGAVWAGALPGKAKASNAALVSVAAKPTGLVVCKGNVPIKRTRLISLWSLPDSLAIADY
jgi:hypothetical protein